jgi:hypothetical protein
MSTVIDLNEDSSIAKLTWESCATNQSVYKQLREEESQI